MKIERTGRYFKLFTLKINGQKYYFIGKRFEKGFCCIFRKSEQAVEAFEIMERIDYAD